MPEPAVAAGQIGGGKTVGGIESDFDRRGGREIRTEAGAGLPIEHGERTDDDRSDRQLVFLQDDQADARAGPGIDAIPAEELLHRRGVVFLIGEAELGREDAEAARVPPTPTGDEHHAEQQAHQRRGEATEPRMPEDELQHEGEGR